MIDPAVEQLIRDGFERWSRGERDLDADWISPNIEIHSGFGESGGGVHRGREAVARWAAEMQEAFVEWRLEPFLNRVDEARALAAACSPGRSA